ncbi:MAG: HEAT repeat domain-containing protein [Promethearchaeota archaeon]
MGGCALSRSKVLIPLIARLKDEGDIEGLVDILFHEESEVFRMDAAKALGQIDDAQVVQQLVTALKRDPDSGVRCEVVLALEEQSRVGCVIARFLRECGRYAVVEFEDWESAALDPLVEALEKDPKSVVREQAAEVLGRRRYKPAKEVLARAIEESQIDDLHWCMVDALAKIEKGRIRDRLLSNPKENDPRVIRITAYILDKLKNTPIRTLLAIVQKNAREVWKRKWAALLLKKARSKESKGAAVEALQ